MNQGIYQDQPDELVIRNAIDQNRKISLVLGVLGFILLGIIAAIPGVYFAHKAKKIEVEAFQKASWLTTLAIVLNYVAIVSSIVIGYIVAQNVLNNV